MVDNPSEIFVVMHEGMFLEGPPLPKLPATYTPHLGMANCWYSREDANSFAEPGDLVLCVQDIYDAIKECFKETE